MTEESKVKPATKKRATKPAESAHPLEAFIPDEANISDVLKRLKANGINTAAEALSNLRGVQKVFQGNDKQVSAFLKACNKEQE